MSFGNDVWDLREGGRGFVGKGELKGNILWSLAPPTVELKPNEMLLYAFSFEKEAGRDFVTGYENDIPVLKPIEWRSLYETDPVKFVGDHISFEMYELKECLNVQTLRTP